MGHSLPRSMPEKPLGLRPVRQGVGGNGWGQCGGQMLVRSITGPVILAGATAGEPRRRCPSRQNFERTGLPELRWRPVFMGA